MIALQHIAGRVSEKSLVLADQVVVSGAAFLTNLLLARGLGVAAYGQFSAVVLGQLFLLSLQQAAGSGIYQVVWPTLTAPRQKRYTNGLFYAQLGWLSGLLAVAGLLYGLWSARFAGYETGLLLATVIATGLYLLQDMLRRMLLVQGRSAQALLLDTLTNAAQIGLLLAAQAEGRLSVSTAFWIIGLTFLPSVLLGLYWLRPGWLRVLDGALAWRLHRQQGGWMLLSALTQWLAGNFQLVAAGWWLGAAALGALRLGQYLFGLLNVGLQALESYVLPRAARLAPSSQHGDSDALLTYLRTVLRKSLLVVLPVLLLLLLGAKPLLTLAGGADYRPFAYVLYGLAAVYVLVVCSYPIRMLLRVGQLTKHYFIGYGLATIASLATAPWLVGAFALRGVLAGLFLTQAILLIYWLFILQQNGLRLWKSYTLFSVKPIRPE